MGKNLYIDAHPNETRVISNQMIILRCEYEGLKNNLIKNNIYLGKVSRIEPSQAAFVDFGKEKRFYHLTIFNQIIIKYQKVIWK